VWGRPFVTALYAVPAVLAGRTGVRVTSLVCALLIAAIAWRVAKDQRYRWPALAFVFTLAQPLVFLHSFSELTELPFALLLALAFWAHARRQWLVMTTLVAMLPTARPEGFGFLFLAAIALVAHRRWWWLVILPLPLLLWSYAGWRLYGRPVYSDAMSLKLPPDWHWLMWLRHEWPYAEKSAYASGPLWHFVALMPVVTSPIVFPFTVLGTWWSLLSPLPVLRERVRVRVRRRGRSPISDHLESEPSPLPSPGVPGEGAMRTPPGEGADALHRARCQLLIAAIPLLILLGHSLLYWLGRMASNGELRYMLVVAPFWALLAAKGWEWAFERFSWRHPLLWAGVAALLPILANVYYRVIPIRLTLDSYKARAVAEWYRGTHVSIDYPRLIATNPELAYYMGVSHTDAGWMREFRKDVVTQAPPGTLLVWDPTYGLSNSDTRRIVTLEEIRRAGWVERPEWSGPINAMGDGTRWRIFLSPRSILGKPPS
jgi:hypothetical protein